MARALLLDFVDYSEQDRGYDVTPIEVEYDPVTQTSVNYQMGSTSPSTSSSVSTGILTHDDDQATDDEGSD